MLTEEEAAKDLSIYRNNTLIVWGCGLWGEHFLTLAEKLDLDIFACCDNDEAKWGTEFHGIPVISPDELEQLNQQKQKNPEEKQIVVQLAIAKNHEISVKNQITSLDISLIVNPIANIVPFTDPIEEHFFKKYPYKTIKKEVDSLKNRSRTYRKRITLPDIRAYDHLVVCQPGKTGDWTITETYSSYSGTPIAHEHDPSFFQKNLVTSRQVKVVSAIRDPISRDLSMVFHHLAVGLVLNAQNVSIEDYKNFLETENPQPIYSKIVEQIFISRENANTRHVYSVFYKSFVNHILDITAHPFDQEKGYAIMKEGNIEVFMYQLEKLNDLTPELSQFMGLKFDKLENDNEASSKWIASSYERAKKEITFSQEYFDTCYNDPYVKHCYSPEDIEKFKEKWRSHIR